jgi:hypothetical protein
MRCRCSSDVCQVQAPFPPKGRQSWLLSILSEIAAKRVVSSKGKYNPRGVRRVKSRYPARTRGALLNQNLNLIAVILFN